MAKKVYARTRTLMPPHSSVLVCSRSTLMTLTSRTNDRRGGADGTLDSMADGLLVLMTMDNEALRDRATEADSSV